MKSREEVAVENLEYHIKIAEELRKENEELKNKINVLLEIVHDDDLGTVETYEKLYVEVSKLE